MVVEQSGLVYRTTSEIRGPILMVEGVKGVAFDEIVNIRRPSGEIVTGSVLDVSRDWAMVQCFGDTSGMDLNIRVRFTGETLKVPMSEELIGRVFSGSFKPLDGIPVPLSTDLRDVNGGIINPAARDVPSEFIQTGLSAIDGMNSLVRGQKLPIFSESGLPHNMMAAQIARQATIPGQETDFAIVFGAMGIKNEEADYFRAEFEKTGALSKSVLVLNLADDPPIERIVTPRIAQTIAEYLAFDLGMHVLVILTDMTNYAEALRTISIAREEVPTRKGYPGYLYSDLATIYERAGRIQGRPGSVTLMPILSMPAGDKTHPVPDLTGYITEGQLILERELSLRGIYPPMNPLPSLSRLMKDGIGEETTREDHQDVSNQLYMAYAEGTRARGLVRIVGEVGLSDRERTWLRFADRFEQEFVNQGPYENRSIEQTLSIAWDLLSILPEEDLIRIRETYINKYHPAHKSDN
ncbi:V-type ATP synthase subunit B [Candidatus Bathyarchaeota archaeon]|nr:V-type ATP synthase subunit B [Candidatus Bathyarchaeota archaeon]MBL7079353.1 V-type ATP synthase subunit B [Candidatus Bathyarchaeota archaeon]